MIADNLGQRTRFVVTCTWDDVPHLNADAKTKLLTSFPEYQRDARSKGVPSLGSGSIYRVPESDIRIAPFPIPRHWARGYGVDVGWNRTAAVFGAHDRENDVIYLYALHYRSQAEPSVNAAGILAHAGDWMPGRIDPASHGRAQDDGQRLIEQYEALGLRVTNADHAVEAGITAVWDRLCSGRLKIFTTLGEWFEEYRLYRRDEKGAIVKQFDHLMDATRYLILSGVAWLEIQPLDGAYRYAPRMGPTPGGWLGR